ncbi:BTAD domain-containing putative transcriptional regulator [Polymorphospora lycopeni]|uniref:BTAD domain-containing putative transcriptional regulator n=1 Tax=Polymorphospora lycopeni TaxID=3140240 RepID=A0ABV5CQC5_9ACTN
MEGLRLSVLGPLAAERDGQPVPLGGRRQRSVLAVLLAARGRMVPADRIEDLVWGADRPTASRTTLHGYVARLRCALEPGRPSRGQGRLLVRDGPGYALRLPPESLDADRFAGLVSRGGTLLDESLPMRAESVLREALALWRGPAYADVGEAPFAVAERARFDVLRATAVERRMVALLAVGQHDTAIGELEVHTAEEPLRERGWQLLATALYRSGRQADALTVLRRARTHLAEKQGIDPGPELRRLEMAILCQDDTVLGGRPEVGAGNLPVAISSFVGRATELAVVGAALDAGRLVTLTGPAGVGKSRLAKEAARHRPDRYGPWYVDLSGLPAGTPVVAALADAIGVPATTVPALADRVGHRAALVVVDNADHLRAEAVPVLTGLLARCPALRVLVTGRRALETPGERVVAVTALSEPDAVRLLGDRVTAAGGAALEPALAAQICRRLDAFPLGIERVAARCAALAPADVLATLDEGLLDDEIEASRRLLTDAGRRLLHRLRVFDGPFTLADAQRVGGGPAATAPLVELIHHSLVLADPGRLPCRYRLPYSVRSYLGAPPSALASQVAAGNPTLVRMRRLSTAVAATLLFTAFTLATPSGAPADPGCQLGDPRPICNGEFPEDPTPLDDAAPTGKIDYYSRYGGVIWITGWARDADGGPVTVRAYSNALLKSTVQATLPHTGQGGNHGFSITFPAPATVGSHQLKVVVANVPNGTAPAAEGITFYPEWYVIKPTTPTGLVLTPWKVGDEHRITVEFTDPSDSEDGFRITYDWVGRKWKWNCKLKTGYWETGTFSESVDLPAQAGRERYSHTIRNLDHTTFYKFYVMTMENARFSEKLVGGINSGEFAPAPDAPRFSGTDPEQPCMD